LSDSESNANRYIALDPDVRLMLRVRDDDATAFEQLVSRYQSRLITIMHHLMGSRDQAEDLAQEVFLRLFRARKRYQPEARFSTFLFTIAHNVASNARRTLARRKEVQVRNRESPSRSVQTLEELAQDASSLMPTRQLDKAEAAEIVNLAMESLNERQRLAVLLCKFEGMSYADIAETMDLTPQAIKSLLARARGNLRDVLQPYLHEGRRPAEQDQSP
jgi:RNA polymerase sigma-70 factor (ECF subfamily)